MTTKRDIERMLEDGDDILGDLDADERTTLCLQRAAADRNDHVTRVVETAPKQTYNMPEHAFRVQFRDALNLSRQAWQELERGVWRFNNARLRGLYCEELARHYDVSDWEFIEPSATDPDWFEADAKAAAGTFLVAYQAWTRVADERFDVALETFLRATAPEPWVDLIDTTAQLADGRAFEQEDGGWAPDEVTNADGTTRTLDDAVDWKVARMDAVLDDAR